MRIVIGVIAIILSLILIAAAMWEFFNMEDEEMIKDNELLKDKDRQLNEYYLEWQKQEKRIAELIDKDEKLEEHNKKLQRACYKWFMRWREEKKEVIRVSNMAGFKCNQELMQKTKEAKEIISEWLRLYNSNTKKTIIKKSENYLKE